MIKKFLATILMTFLLLQPMCSFASNDNITVYVDDKTVMFDVQPQMIGGRTMVPLRAIFESLGATVEWEEATKSITAYNEAYMVKAQIDSPKLMVNGVEKTMDITPLIVDGRTLVPARFVAEAFDCDVNWDGNTKTVNITTKPINYNNLEKDTNSNITSVESKNEKQAYSESPIYFNKYSFQPTRQIEVACTNIIKGSQANAIINSENMFNDKPSAGQEWIIMEFCVKYISSSEGKDDELEASDIIYKDKFYAEDKSSLNVYDSATLGDKYGAYSVFNVKMYPGSSAKKVVIGLLIDKYEGNILLKIPTNAGKSNEWIECNPISTNDADVKSSEDNSSKETSSTSKKYYKGTGVPTYTSITGVKLKNLEKLSSGSTVYQYKYSSSDDVGDYWKALIDNGWVELDGDDPTTNDVFESAFYKGTEFVICNVYLYFDEVWITPAEV